MRDELRYFYWLIKYDGGLDAFMNDMDDCEKHFYDFNYENDIVLVTDNPAKVTEALISLKANDDTYLIEEFLGFEEDGEVEFHNGSNFDSPSNWLITHKED